MVAETHNETLSLVITDCWSPVMGNSRMSTFSILSKNGRRTRRPGWSTDLNWPRRLTTPTLPCWTILRQREANQTAPPPPTTTTATTTPMISPADASMVLSLAVRSVDHEEAALYVGHHHLGPHPDALVRIQGNGEPLLAPGPDPARVVLPPDLPRDEGRVTHHPLDPTEHGPHSIQPDQRPTYVGSRFSVKAARASLVSSLAKLTDWQRASFSRASSMEEANESDRK